LSYQNKTTGIINLKLDRYLEEIKIPLPGLKQPAIQEILKNEEIDKGNEIALLKRFGRKTITNPYELVMA